MINKLCGYRQNLMLRDEAEARTGLKLKPCPFCAGVPALHMGPTTHVTCTSCAADGPPFERNSREFHHQEEAAYRAIHAWNTRFNRED